MQLSWATRLRQNFDLMALAELDLSPAERLEFRVADLERRLAAFEGQAVGASTSATH